MYAVINDRGRQYKTTAGERLVLDRMDAEVGAESQLPVILTADGAKVQVGSPALAVKAKVKVLRHFRGEKGLGGFFRRRKDSRRRVGFRHEHTEVQVVSID